MSDDYNGYDKKPNKGRGNGYKGGKGVKVYFEVKQGDGKGSDADRYYDREDDGYQSKSNGGHYRQSSRHYDNNYNNSNYQNHYHKNNGYNNKSSKREQPVYRKKQESYVKVSKEDALERYDKEKRPEEGFSDVMDANPEIFTKNPLKPVNVGFKSFDLPHDDCLNGTKAGNTADSKPFSNGNGHNKQSNEHYAEKGTRTFVRWDDGGSEDILGTIGKLYSQPD